MMRHRFLKSPRMASSFSVILACLFAAIVDAASAAVPTLEHLFPAGGRRGDAVTVKATGKFSGEVSAWCSRDDVKLKVSGKESSRRSLTVEIPKDAKPGICWIRLHNDEGATAPRPFLIGTVAEATEKEPNNRLSDSIPVFSEPTTVNGVLAKSRDVDNFAVDLKKGETLVAVMTANATLGSPMDGVLQVVSENGFILAQNDDLTGFDPRIVFVATDDGKYFVRAFAFPATPNSTVRFAGGSDYIYRLTITAGPYVDYAYPLAVRRGATEPVELHGWNLPADHQRFTLNAPPDEDSAPVWSPRLANMATVERVDADAFTEETWRATHENHAGAPSSPQKVPAVVTGRLSSPGETDRYRFRAKKGDRLEIAVVSRALGFPTDPVLSISDAKGKTLKRAETRSSSEIDESTTLTVPADGEYVAEVSDLHGRGGKRFVYRLDVRKAKPGFRLEVKNDAFQLTPGKPLEIPVTVNRQNGFDGEIEFLVIGLPAGIDVKTSAAKSGGKGRGRGRSGSKTITLTLSANPKSAKAHSGPIRIIGRVTKGKPAKQIAVAPIEGLETKTADLWLTLLAKKASSAKSKSGK